MLIGFVVASSLGIEAAWVAGAAALVLAVRALVRKEVSLRSLGGSLNIPFIAFVLGLGIVVMAVVHGGLGSFLGHLAPTGNGLVSLLLWALLAAVLANLVNNLPAVLLVLPLAAAVGPLAVLASDHDHEVSIGEFTVLGLLTTPASLVAGVTALWVVGAVVLGGT